MARHLVDLGFDAQLDVVIEQIVKLQQDLVTKEIQEYLPENLRGSEDVVAVVRWLNENKYVFEFGGCTIRITRDGTPLKELRVTYNVDVDILDRKIIIPTT